MIKQKEKKSKYISNQQQMNRKVKLKDFVFYQSKVMVELFRAYKKDVVIIVLLLCSMSLRDMLNVKFIEHLTNSVSELVQPDGGNLTAILIKTSLFIGVILTAYIIHWVYTRFDAKFKEKISYDIERKFKEKLSNIPYEHFENNQFHEKIKRARNAGGDYGKAVYSVSQFFRIVVTMIIYSVILAGVSWAFPVILFLANIITL